MKTNINETIHWAPDERGGASEGGERESSLPQTVEVDGKEVDFDDLVNGFKFSQANHERAEQIKREREAFQQEREAFRREREQSQQVQQQTLEALQRLGPQEQESEEPIFNYRQAIKELNLVDDEEAPEKLGQVLDTALATERDRLQQDYDQRLREHDQRLEERFKETEDKIRKQITQADAVEKADTANSELFNSRLQQDYKDVMEQLTPQDIQKVEKKFRSLISDEHGEFDRQGQWRWKPSAVDDALWAAEPSRQVLLARSNSEARSQGLRAHVRGQEASRSTPTRTQRRAGSDPNEALVQRMEEIDRAVTAGEITRDEAMQRMGSVDDARKMLALRRQHLRQPG